MNYVNSVLQPGEKLEAHSTIHWLVYGRAIAALVAAAACFVVSLQPVQYHTPFRWLSAFFAACAVILFVPAWVHRFSTEIAVTDRRIILKKGLIQRHTIEINMDKVESVDVDQSIFGRVFDFGTVTVHGTGASIEPLRNVSAPIKLRNAVMVHPRTT